MDELVQQARRLFSSKNNGGKQVPQLTDRLHTYKQVVIAFSVLLLLGYSQFREHFTCRGFGSLDSRMTTNFCLINGTITVVSSSNATLPQAGPHAGIRYVTSSSERVISHNYMRSYWLLLILLAICSQLARMNWASLFKSEVLRALLQLVGYSELRQVRAADCAKTYEMLSRLSSDLNQELKKRIAEDPKLSEMSRTERVSRCLDLVDEYVTIYDQTLDYYPNQLTYLLLTNKTASFKLTGLKLRRKLIQHALASTALASLQLVLSLVFLGNEYALYGWRYLFAAVRYLNKQLTDSSAALNNSIDYELSSQLFPINSLCMYKQYGMTGSLETFSVQCSIPINEISSKFFVVIWWLVMASLAVELWTLAALVLSSLNFKTISLTFGLSYWPGARDQAELIATFRHKRSTLINRYRLIEQMRRAPAASENSQPAMGRVGVQSMAPHFDDSDEQLKRKKKLESGLSYAFDDGVQTECRSSKRWYMWCLRDICLVVRGAIANIVCCSTNKQRGQLEYESEKDINIFYLLYLLYLRLGNSRSKTEEVIRMTACALNNYLVDLEAQCERLKMGHESKEREVDTGDYN